MKHVERRYSRSVARNAQILVVVLLLLGSGSAAAKEKTYTSNFAGWGPLFHGVYQAGFLPWKQDVEKATKGRVCTSSEPLG